MALLLISLIVLDKVGMMKLDCDLMVSLARLLAVFICVDAFFIGCGVFGYRQESNTCGVFDWVFDYRLPATMKMRYDAPYFVSAFGDSVWQLRNSTSRA